MSFSSLRRSQYVTLFTGVPLAALVVVASLGCAYALGAIVPRPSPEEAPEVVHPWMTLPEFGPTPPGGRSEIVTIGSTHLWYAVYGPDVHEKTALPPVLLLHGGLADSAYWNYLVPALVAQGRSVITMDTRGHGRSPGNPELYHYSSMVRDVGELLGYLKIPQVDCVGWSDGGIVGIELALQKPQLLRKLFAYGANTTVDGVRTEGDEDPVSKLGSQRAEQEYRKVSGTPQEWNSLNEQINKMWLSEPTITDEELRTIHVKTMIADGEYDEVIYRAHTEHIAATIPGAKLAILPEVSHFGMLQKPAEFNASVIDFLQ